ncbi:MAG: lamin tail domain-containing protein [Bacteroidetes bacterium]|nr:lamin tail domain-containing protein [Bacteroidota bacterium]
MKKIVYFLTILLINNLNAQVLINEVANTNQKFFEDEEGDFPDWIELYNAGATDVNLAGYSLTDNAGTWDQWIFPDTVLGASERLIVYASGKNRNCLSCPESEVDHWETAIFEDDIWQYKNGTSSPGAGWNDIGFAGAWNTGPGGFGNSDGDDNTLIVGWAASLYYRKTFDVEDKSKIIKTIISMDYDDGYVIYLNGVELARMNIIGSPTYNTYANYWHEALMYLGLRPKTIEVDSALIADNLVNGENVLAVEIHQYGADDATGRTWLHFGISTPEIFYSDNPDWFSNPGTAPDLHTNFKLTNAETVSLYNSSGILLDSINLTNIIVDHVRARIPDAGSWCYAETATPAAINGGTCFTGYANTPVIVTAPGFYAGSVNVIITGSEIHYTTDGSTPDESSALYTGAISVSSTGVIKAICTEAGKLQSDVAVASYLIDEPTLLPVISVSANPCDLFDEGPDCIAAYDNAEGWFNHNPIVPVTVEYFDADGIKQFADNYKMECVGNFSISLDQKSMRFLVDEDYGSKGEILYNIFEHDKPEITSIHGFRVRNMDQDYTGTRMKDITINRIGISTTSISTAYQNVAVFINGEYWGMYGAREEMDEYFLRDNFGVDPEKVDLIKTGWGGEEKTIAEAGSDTAFYRLVDFITNNDMSIPANYALAIEEIDVENWVDYFSTGFFTDNEEWLQMLENNIRLFRSYEPDIKWKYMLWDCTNSQFFSNANTLQGSLSNPNNSKYADMFNALLENQIFHDYFINRFADLINYYFTEVNNDAIVSELEIEMGTEIPAQNARWYTGNFAAWSTNIDYLYEFYDNRNSNQRNQIETYFDLEDQVDITLAVNPPGAGYVKISTIVPTELPWTGIYFNGVPVQVTALPNPGFTFTAWTPNGFILDPSQISFTNNITLNTTFTANFTGAEIANPIVISEINYNSESTINSGDWLELHNTSATPVHISNYTFSNKYFYNDFKIPVNTIIPANGYLVIAEDVDSFMVQHPFVTNVIGDFHFNLENEGDSVMLKDFTNNIISSFTYKDIRPWPFTADGYGRTMEKTSDIANPGLPNSWFEGCVGGSPGIAYSPCFENPLVDEINYNSLITEDAGDWFELYNYSAVDIDVSGWKVKDKNQNEFIIPAGTILEGENYIAFYTDEVKFSTQFPSVTNKVGPVDFGFNGTGDVILLYDATGNLFQSVGFDDDAPYPLAPDGGGYTLQIVNVSNNINDPLNWMSACPEGSPGAAYETPCTTEIISEQINGSLFVYPNPAQEIIYVVLPENINGATCIITDISGKQLYSTITENSETININLSEFNSGMYLLRIMGNNIQYSASFIVN